MTAMPIDATTVVPGVEQTGSAVSSDLTVSVVICAYTTDRWHDFIDAVNSALGQKEYPIHEVIVVIDHCETLLDRARERFADEPSVAVLTNSESRGLSGARNTGLRAATGDVVAFLDDDAVAAPDWSSRLLAHYGDSEVMGVGGYARPLWPGSRPSWFPREFDWVVGCSYVGQPQEVSPVRNFIGCNMSLRRSVFADVGVFDSSVGRLGTSPAGCEETELCIRIGAHRPSARLLYDPSAQVTHRVTEQRTTVRYFVTRCYHEGISKSVVAQLAGARDALSSERTYTTRVLPRAVAAGLCSPRRGGFARAAVVFIGFAATTAGYVRGRAVSRIGGRRA